jgi:hypothetical protein
MEAMEATNLRQSTGPEVSGTVDALVLDLLEWIGPNPRPYAEVLEAWRTSCPRLPVWEDANDRGFIARQHAQPAQVWGKPWSNTTSSPVGGPAARASKTNPRAGSWSGSIM